MRRNCDTDLPRIVKSRQSHVQSKKCGAIVIQIYLALLTQDSRTFSLRQSLTKSQDCVSPFTSLLLMKHITFTNDNVKFPVSRHG